jgi:hypothetical protein
MKMAGWVSSIEHGRFGRAVDRIDDAASGDFNGQVVQPGHPAAKHRIGVEQLFAHLVILRPLARKHEYGFIRHDQQRPVTTLMPSVR